MPRKKITLSTDQTKMLKQLAKDRVVTWVNGPEFATLESLAKKGLCWNSGEDDVYVISKAGFEVARG